MNKPLPPTLAKRMERKSNVLTVYGRKSSFNVQKVMWLVGELGIDHTHVERGGSFGGLQTPEFRALNPHGRVPVIDDNGTIVWESHAILRYLAARYSPTVFWSEDPAERSMADRWMDWAACSLQPDFLNGIFWGYYRTPAGERNLPQIAEKIRRCAAHFQLLDSLLADRVFLLGDHLTLADIPAGTNLYRYFNIAITRPSVPHVERWYRTLQERPAYCAHVMFPFGELYGRLAY
jgi:glutathione S-transferase